MKKIIIFAALCLSFLTACDKEDLGGSNIHVPEFDYNALSETDKYIYDHYTVPYNVEVVYRWNQGDVSSDDMRKNLVPPRESQVEPFLEMIEKVWVDTYTAEVGQQTLRSYIPKQILLVGSASYNDDGSTTEGTAEGGRQIVLYSVNDFNFELEQIQSYAHVMHHEFAHILHQNVEYDAEFEKITPSYSSSWMQMNDETARSKGFITAYASSSADEDFAEMVSIMLTNSPEDWDNMIENAGNAAAVEALRKKEAIVVAYMKNNWGVNMKDLNDEENEKIWMGHGDAGRLGGLCARQL